MPGLHQTRATADKGAGLAAAATTQYPGTLAKPRLRVRPCRLKDPAEPYLSSLAEEGEDVPLVGLEADVEGKHGARGALQLRQLPLPLTLQPHLRRGRRAPAVGSRSGHSSGVRTHTERRSTYHGRAAPGAF